MKKLFQKSSNDNRAQSQASAMVNSNIKKKQISFVSAIFIVIGSCIGSGIFLKSSSVLENSWYSLPLAISTWLLSAIAVIAMSLALVEVSAKGSSNLSMIGWVKNFNKKQIYKACKNFMFYIYTPLTFFFMPLYVINAFQDSLSGFGLTNNFGTSADFLIWTVIAILISSWFIFTSGFSSKLGNIQNWLITSVKFFPIVVTIILGFVITGSEHPTINVKPQEQTSVITSFKLLSPGIGMFMSFGAIFFAFDGFYYSNGIQSEMKEPKKAPIALLIGLVITTAIYLLIAISMSIANPNDGSFGSFSDYLTEKNVGWLYGLMNLLIAIGILGIINGMAMWATRFSEDLIKLGELPFFYKFIRKLNSHRPKVGVIYTIVPAILALIIFSLIGGLTYVPYGYTDSLNNSNYDGNGYNSMAKLLGFADLMGNWTSIIAFAFIVSAITGCLLERKKILNDQQSHKTKYFVPAATVAIILVGIGMIFQFIAPFVDLFLMLSPKVFAVLDNNDIISRVMTIVVLIIYLIMMIVPSYFDYDSKFISKIMNVSIETNDDGLQVVKSVEFLNNKQIIK